MEHQGEESVARFCLAHASFLILQFRRNALKLNRLWHKEGLVSLLSKEWQVLKENVPDGFEKFFRKGGSTPKAPNSAPKPTEPAPKSGL